jgi:hypothetical protein
MKKLQVQAFKVDIVNVRGKAATPEEGLDCNIHGTLNIGQQCAILAAHICACEWSCGALVF